ncbi:hypothetical protein M407DRAFT_28816 [Tulasnella calospora MUT 4182]|uniref:Extracellular membrane protein CFEM domain-containing protein n=1 Tax=Tulasnella calospora MUT 4182 TaxID=1051891 RepID=A0A0C3LJM7_9AGAM|nr:hypothetical protein M407DRAFT_28816 [Tulasnella calospora MUT 4182]
MHFKSILPSATLFFIAVSSANASPESSEGSNQAVTRSTHLSLRQLTGEYGSCVDICETVQSKLVTCGARDSCSCGTSVTVPLHDCVTCVYAQSTDASLRTEQVDVYNKFLDDCKAAGYPVTGDTTFPEAASLSSVASSASATASSTSATKSASNGAIGTSSRSATGLAFPVVLVAAFGFLF